MTYLKSIFFSLTFSVFVGCVTVLRMKINVAFLNKQELVFEVKVGGAVPVESVVEFRRQFMGLLATRTPVALRKGINVYKNLEAYRPLLEELGGAVLPPEATGVSFL